MKSKELLLLVSLTLFCINIKAIHPFQLQSDKGEVIHININKIFTESKTIPLIDNNQLLGFGISGKIEKRGTDFLVRVLLQDVEGHEHLVLEMYDMVAEEDFLTFEDYCEETIILDKICPKELKIILVNANLKIKNLSYIKSPNGNKQTYSSISDDYVRQRKVQIEDIIRRINVYNCNHHRLWVAGITPLSYKSYKDKVKLFGLADNIIPDGFEYYTAGIFEAGRAKNYNRLQNNSSYVDYFDWRNRHGKNWLNSVKNQMGSSYCVAFASAGTIEGRMNLYFNRLLHEDLSAQNIAVCAQRAGTNSYYEGLWYDDVLPFLQNNGVCDDYSYPFENNPSAICNIDNINYRELVKINSYTNIGYSNIDSIKKTIIHEGPLLSGYIGHSMVLVGYGVIHAGDSIRISDGDIPENHIYIPTGSPYVGETYWIFKNSYGEQSGITTDGGYAYILFNDMSMMRGPYRLNYPFTIQPSSSHSVLCEDADGDGYYTWGLGTRPNDCPSWAPVEQDGDDSDPDYGPMDQYGNLTMIDYTSQSTISGNVSYNNNTTFSSNIVVMPGAVLTITGTVTLGENVKLTIRPSGTLVINGGTLQNAELFLNSGCSVIINNGGHIYMRAGRSFNATLGSEIIVNNGDIQ